MRQGNAYRQINETIAGLNYMSWAILAKDKDNSVARAVYDISCLALDYSLHDTTQAIENYMDKDQEELPPHYKDELAKLG